MDIINTIIGFRHWNKKEWQPGQTIGSGPRLYGRGWPRGNEREKGYLPEWLQDRHSVVIRSSSPACCLPVVRKPCQSQQSWCYSCRPVEGFRVWGLGGFGVDTSERRMVNVWKQTDDQDDSKGRPPYPMTRNQDTHTWLMTWPYSVGFSAQRTTTCGTMRINLPNRMAVAKVEGRNDLPEKSPGLFRCQSALFDQIIEQLAARDVFQNKISFRNEKKKGKI